MAAITVYLFPNITLAMFGSYLEERTLSQGTLIRQLCYSVEWLTLKFNLRLIRWIFSWKLHSGHIIYKPKMSKFWDTLLDEATVGEKPRQTPTELLRLGSLHQRTLKLRVICIIPERDDTGMQYIDTPVQLLTQLHRACIVASRQYTQCSGQRRKDEGLEPGLNLKWPSRKQ